MENFISFFRVMFMTLKLILTLRWKRRSQKLGLWPLS